MSFASLLSGAPAAAGVSFLVELIVKGTLLLALATVLVLVLRRASAAHRHLVWACALIGLVALPWMQLSLPRWRVSTPLAGAIAPGFGLLATTVEPDPEAVTATGEFRADMSAPADEKTYKLEKHADAKPDQAAKRDASSSASAMHHARRSIRRRRKSWVW